MDTLYILFSESVGSLLFCISFEKEDVTA